MSMTKKILGWSLVVLGAPGIPGSMALMSVGLGHDEPKFTDVPFYVAGGVLFVAGLPFYWPLWEGIRLLVAEPATEGLVE
jgi:hypothetical protein